MNLYIVLLTLVLANLLVPVIDGVRVIHVIRHRRQYAFELTETTNVMGFPAMHPDLQTQNQKAIQEWQRQLVSGERTLVSSHS